MTMQRHPDHGIGEKSQPFIPPKTAPLIGQPYQEIDPSRRLGRDLPLPEGLDLLGDYLAGMETLLKRAAEEPHSTARATLYTAMQPLPAWRAYVMGIASRVRVLEERLPPQK